MVQLSKRLSAVAEAVLSGGTLADIGTDHALLPVFLVQRGIVPKAVAGDIHPGPVQAAERQVRAAGLAGKIDVRIGNGLSVLNDESTDTITIAGMGGGTIVSILSEGKATLQGASRLVLQPNVGERLVREWLCGNGWKLVHETLLEEDGLTYVVIAADQAASEEEAAEWNRCLYERPLPGYGRVSPSILFLVGPLLIRQPSPLFLEKWTHYLSKLDRLAEQIGNSQSSEAIQKRQKLLTEKNEISGVLAWLSK